MGDGSREMQRHVRHRERHEAALHGDGHLVAGADESVVILDGNVQQLQVGVLVVANDVVLVDARPRDRRSHGGVERQAAVRTAHGKQMHGLEDDGTLVVVREGLDLERLLGALRVCEEHHDAGASTGRRSDGGNGSITTTTSISGVDAGRRGQERRVAASDDRIVDDCSATHTRRSGLGGDDTRKQLLDEVELLTSAVRVGRATLVRSQGGRRRWRSERRRCHAHEGSRGV